MTIHANWRLDLYTMISPWKFQTLELQLDTNHFFVSFFWRWHSLGLPFRASIGRNKRVDKRGRVRQPWKEIKIGVDHV